MDLNEAILQLKARGFSVRCFDEKAQAATYLVEKFHGKTIGIGGSVTIDALHIYDALQAENSVYWHWKQPGIETLEKAAFAQVYLTSANAIAATGEIINIDGLGNRIAATLFHKEEVYFIVGINKFADNFEAAVNRARNVAAPKNAQRLGVHTPCAKHGDRCYDCRSPERICRGLSVLWEPMREMQTVEVVIILETLGY